MRIQFMAEEGTSIAKGASLLDFDNSSLADRVRELETQILDAETQIVARRSELASSLKDLEIELAERQFEHARTRVEATIDQDVLSRKEYNERLLAYEKATRELEETLQRTEKTRSSGSADMDVLIINKNKLKKDLESAQNDLQLLSIKAPADGLIVYEKRQRSTLKFQEGDSCWPNEGIIQLPDLNEMRVEFLVHEVDAPLLEVGMPVIISLDAFPGKQITGSISHIPSMAVKATDDSEIAVFRVKAALDETWVGEMKPGMSVLGRAVVERMENVPRVARRAVRFDGDAYWFSPQGGPAKLPEERIEPLARNSSWYVISEDDFARLGGAAQPRERTASLDEPR
jgi:multidrug efflux pump subunit AcrA (membrane-fusion protein)